MVESTAQLHEAKGDEGHHYYPCAACIDRRQDERLGRMVNFTILHYETGDAYCFRVAGGSTFFGPGDAGISSSHTYLYGHTKLDSRPLYVTQQRYPEAATSPI